MPQWSMPKLQTSKQQMSLRLHMITFVEVRDYLNNMPFFHFLVLVDFVELKLNGR
jgi:hypothetical protein